MLIVRSLSRAVLISTILFTAAAGVLAAEPGIPIPFESEAAQVNDQARGFMLIYNYYSPSMTNPALQNTRFSITNTSDQSGIAVHLFFR